MSNLSPLLLLSLGELLLVTSILSVVMVVLAVVRKHRDRASAGKLITRIKQDEARRQQETRDLIGQNFRLQGELLEALVKKIGREEKFFYQTLINLYLKRDAAALEVLHVAFEGATEPYRTLQLPEPNVAQDTPAADGDESAELTRLRQENERLSEELRITMDTMGRMLSEYSSMYTGGSATESDKEKIMNMFRAEAEQQPGNEPEGSSPAASSTEAEETAAADAAKNGEDQGNGGGGDTAPARPASEGGQAPAQPDETPVAQDLAEDDFEEDLLSLDDSQVGRRAEPPGRGEKPGS